MKYAILALLTLATTAQADHPAFLQFTQTKADKNEYVVTLEFDKHSQPYDPRYVLKAQTCPLEDDLGRCWVRDYLLRDAVCRFDHGAQDNHITAISCEKPNRRHWGITYLIQRLPNSATFQLVKNTYLSERITSETIHDAMLTPPSLILDSGLHSTTLTQQRLPNSRLTGDTCHNSVIYNIDLRHSTFDFDMGFYGCRFEKTVLNRSTIKGPFVRTTFTDSSLRYVHFVANTEEPDNRLLEFDDCDLGNAVFEGFTIWDLTFNEFTILDGAKIGDMICAQGSTGVCL